MDVMVGTLREGMKRGDDAVEGILSQCCGREAMPVPGGTARTAQRRRRDAAIGVLTPDAAGAALSAGSVLGALTSAFDLVVHAVNLGEHVFGLGLHLSVGSLAVRVVLNAEFVLDGIKHVEDAGDCMLREEPNVHIQLRPAVRLVAEAVLADEHEGRQKDGLQRHNHRQEPIGKGIEWRYPDTSGVHEQPSTKLEDMEVHKNHTARKGRHSIGQAVLHGPFLCGLETL